VSEDRGSFSTAYGTSLAPPSAGNESFAWGLASRFTMVPGINGTARWRHIQQG
jgi:hypothetical protein